MNHVVHYAVSACSLVNRVSCSEAVLQFFCKSLPNEFGDLPVRHFAQFGPVTAAPPFIHLLRVSDSRQRPMQPTDPEEVKYLDLVVRRFFVGGQFLDSFPMTFKHALVKEAECRLLLSDLPCVEDIGDRNVEITWQDFNLPVQFATFCVMRRLDLLEPSQCGEAFSILFAKKEMPQPHRLAFQNQLCCPCVSLAFVLRAGKTIYISTMLCDLDKNSKVLLNEFGLMLGPNRSTNALIATRFALSVDW